MRFIGAAVLSVFVAMSASAALGEDAVPATGIPGAETPKAETPKADTPAAAKDAKPAAPKTVAKKPVARKKPDAPRMIGKVAVVDADTNYVQLDGPWTGTFPVRTWLTSYRAREGDTRLYALTVEFTHHAEAERGFTKVASEPAAEGISIKSRQRANLQCTKNRGGEQVCFHTEVYTIDLPEQLLADRRKQGVALQLSADGAERLDVKMEPPQIEAQLAAMSELEKKPVLASVAKPAQKPAPKPAPKKAASSKPATAKPAADKPVAAGKSPDTAPATAPSPSDKPSPQP
jgi:hypothetical protein